MQSRLSLEDGNSIEAGSSTQTEKQLSIPRCLYGSKPYSLLHCEKPAQRPHSDQWSQRPYVVHRTHEHALYGRKSIENSWCLCFPPPGACGIMCYDQLVSLICGRCFDGRNASKHQAAGHVFSCCGYWGCGSTFSGWACQMSTMPKSIALMATIGMHASSFYAAEAPSSIRGCPIELPIVIGSVAIITCMASTGLLAHSATIV